MNRNQNKGETKMANQNIIGKGWIEKALENMVNEDQRRGAKKAATVRYQVNYTKALKRIEAITIEMAKRMKNDADWGDVGDMSAVNEYLHNTAMVLGLETEDDE